MIRKHDPRRAGALMSLVVGVSLLCGRAHAQIRSASVQEINPDRSTLDARDPFGASGGRVQHLALSVRSGPWFAASEWGGLFRSADQGRTWEHLPGHVPTATWDVAVDFENPRRVYATSFYDGKVASLAGINVSVDGGDSWTHPPTATPPAGFCVNAVRRDEPSAFGIAINPANPRNVLIGTNCGLAISDDNGQTWRFVDPTPADGADDVWDVIVHHGGIIDLIGDDGHRRSTNGGVSWTTTSALFGGVSSIDVSPDEANVLFATTGTQIWQSTDGGASWTGLTNPSFQGRIPFVKTNQRSGASFDLWFGDINLSRATCTTPSGGGTAARCPANAWTNFGGRPEGAHADMGSIVFDPSVADDACPLALSSDGGVYLNTVRTSPACHSPAWEQPVTTPHALWLWDLSGASYPGALNDVVIGRRSNVNMRYAILDDAAAGFAPLHEGGNDWGSGNYTTSVATGDVDGDGLEEYVIGRRTDVNMRFVILDDAAAGFAQLFSGGSGWGSGNYATSVATGDVDGDGLDEVIIGRHSDVNMRYVILDDKNANFVQLHQGGQDWGSGNYTTSVAAGDLDGDGLDEVIIGRRTDVNMRYEILDDALAGFARLHEGGNGWGSGNYTTSVAAGDLDGDGLDEVIIGRRSNVNMRYEILDDAKAGFAQIHEGGNGWGSGNYTTSVAAGDVDGDGLEEVVIGRRSNVNMRYLILDDAAAGFAQIHEGGNGWGSGNYTTSVAAGDLDNDGLDEVIIGRRSNVNMRYLILDDAAAGFAQLHEGGNGWGSGNYTTSVAAGPFRRNRLDLHFGNQDTGTFATTNGEELKPAWRNVDCCDSFEVPSTQTQMLVTVCCFNPPNPPPANRLFLRRPGMFDGAQVTLPPTGSLQGFRPTDDAALFGPSSAAVTMTTGVFITDDITASPPVWTQLGAASMSGGARHITPIGQGPSTVFYVQAPNGDLRLPDSLFRYSGTAPGGTWQRIQPPGGVGGFSLFAVDPQNAQRVVACHLVTGQPPAMIMSLDGGGTWSPMPALDARMNGGGAFRAQTQRGPTAFTSFSGYPQPQLFAFSPRDPNLMVAAGNDSGVFVSADGGANWTLVSDPISPASSGTPHIPRPQFAYFDHLRDGSGLSQVDIYVGTRGRGVFRIRTGYVPRPGAGGGRPRPAGAPAGSKSARPEDRERPGKPDPTDDTTGKKKSAAKPEAPGKPDPSDDSAGVKKPVPERPGKPEPSDDPSGSKTYPPKPER